MYCIVLKLFHIFALPNKHYKKIIRHEKTIRRFYPLRIHEPGLIRANAERPSRHTERTRRDRRESPGRLCHRHADGESRFDESLRLHYRRKGRLYRGNAQRQLPAENILHGIRQLRTRSKPRGRHRFGRTDDETLVGDAGRSGRHCEHGYPRSRPFRGQCRGNSPFGGQNRQGDARALAGRLDYR